jgi:hypothetical protein
VDLDDETGQILRAVDNASSAKTTVSPDRPDATSEGASDPSPLRLSGSGAARSLPIRIVRHLRSLANQTVLSAQVSRRSIDVLQETTFTVRHGNLGSLEIRVPASIADRWELPDRDGLDREALGRDADGNRDYRLTFRRPAFDKAVVRFGYHIPIAPGLDGSTPRELAMPWISFPGVVPETMRLGLSMAGGLEFRVNDPAWMPADVDASNGGRSTSTLAFTRKSDAPARPFSFKALALDPVELPSLLVPRLLIRTVQDADGTTRSRARYWLETHGPALFFAMPEGARWLAARVDGRVSDQVDYEASRPGYRLRLPPEARSRPTLVEVEYQVDAPAIGSRWQCPQLLDGGVVLETLWDVQLPGDREIVGVPPGWSDENEWYWSGWLWRRRPEKNGLALDQWVGEAASSPAGERRSASDDESYHWLFSRSGRPTDLRVLVLTRAWIVAACSGATLFIGFLAIFAHIRFRTAWAIAAILTLLSAALLRPSVTWLIVQSSFIGIVLTVLGLLIQRLLDRPKASARTTRELGPGNGQVASDSSLERPAVVGSDDSTAIRVRVPSTMDYIPSPITGSASDDPARSSPLGRT